MRHQWTYPIILISGILQIHCAAARLTSMDDRILADLVRTADSLFAAENFVHARLVYTRIQNKYEKSPAGENAQFMLGYLQIHHNNNFGDREAAIREFRRYQTLYKDGKRIDEVQNWLNLLTSLQSFERGYSESVTRMDELASKQTLDQRKQTQLIDYMLRCDNMRDSLKSEIESLRKKIKEHEDFMLNRIK